MDAQARRAADAPVDLGPVIATGDRRRRVRGSAAVGVAGAVAAAIAFGGVQVIGNSDEPGSAQFAAPGERIARAATYASGSTIHQGDEAIDTGRTIQAFVQTDDGFVYVAANGDVWFTDGQVQRKIGRNDGGASNEPSRLAADESGPYVAWADASAQEFVVYDTASRDTVVRVPSRPDAGDGPYVFAVDGSSAYVLDRRGLSRIDIPTGEVDVLRSDVRYRSDIADVENGRILTGRGSGGDVALQGARDLAPGGRYATTDVNDSEQIVDTATKDEVVLETSEYDFQGMIRWLDGDTVAVPALKNPDAAEPDLFLLTCEVPSGECTLVAEDLPSDVVLPIGGDRPPRN